MSAEVWHQREMNCAGCGRAGALWADENEPVPTDRLCPPCSGGDHQGETP